MALFVNILQTVNIITLQKALSRQVMGLIWFPGLFRHRLHLGVRYVSTLYFMCILIN